MSEDRRLLKCLRRGDKDALRRIYEKYMNILLTVAVSLLSDVDAAEDCLHDVFVGFAGAVGDSPIRSNLKSYLISCVANRARDRLRKKARKHNRKLEESDFTTAPGDPSSRLIDCEEACRVYEALAKLPYQQREVFVLHVQGEMKFKEIAGLLGVSINTTQSRYRYGIKKLRTLLENEEKDES